MDDIVYLTALLTIGVHVCSSFVTLDPNLCGLGVCCPNFELKGDRCIACSPGRLGVNCRNHCPDGLYGQNCWMKCPLECNKTCDKAYGFCSKYISGMSHLWTIPDDTPDVVREEEVTTLEDPMDTAMKGLVLSAENLPMPVSIDDSLSLFIEQRTRGQRKCQIWKELHKGRITSSLFGAVLTSRPSPTSLIKQVIHGSSLDRYPTLPVPVRWGVEHEQNALVDYLALQNAVTSLRVEESGLTIYPSHAFLGATSDGWVYDESMPEGNQKGVLEIKCPYSICNDVITHREVHELVGRKGFCLEESENGPRLIRNHSYYAQIQGEMAIMGCAWGDFVVWTAAEQSNCFVERTYFDPDFCSFMLPKLVEWFISNISPSYIKS